MSDMEPLTHDIYEFIVDFIRTKGFSPSLREIAKGCYVAHSSLYAHLGVLEGKDWIAREFNIPRSIRLGKNAPDYIPPEAGEDDEDDKANV